MQILRTKGTKHQSRGGNLYCITSPTYLPRIIFRYVPGPDSSFFVYYSVGYITPISKSFTDMPIGMSADACIQYWEDL